MESTVKNLISINTCPWNTCYLSMTMLRFTNCLIISITKYKLHISILSQVSCVILKLRKIPNLRWNFLNMIIQLVGKHIFTIGLLYIDVYNVSCKPKPPLLSHSSYNAPQPTTTLRYNSIKLDTWHIPVMIGVSSSFSILMIVTSSLPACWFPT